MRIVILDGYTLNPGDLSWEQFQSLGECVIYDRTPVNETINRAMGCDILLTNKALVTRDMLDQLPDLKYIGLLATGYNVVDVKAAAERHIPVTNVPEYGTQSVAQMVFAHVLNLCQHAAEHSSSVRQGKWSQSKDFCFWDFPLVELAGLTIGIVGLGRIGSTVANTARAFGMDVLAFDPVTPSPKPDQVTLTDIEAVFQKSDVVSLHCPLTELNRGFVNAKLLGLMKHSSFLINTSRGQLINEADLAEALNKGTIAAAGLDVLAVEPPDPGNPLLTARNCYITPHISWATRSARQRLMATAAGNVEAFMHGKSMNVVNEV
ncbi:MAG TPA: D-2-hydroxyacid dehydrogenase [Leptolinea sp.]